jgi:hypothetical protein
MKSFNRAVEWCHRKISPDPRQWPSRFPLLRWNGLHSFTIGHSLGHVLELGATGSGKTSACLKDMALGMLHAGYGVLFLSAKSTDPEDYLEWARLAGREKSVVHFGPRHRLGVNLMEYELARKGEFTERTINVSSILKAAGEILVRDGKASPGDGETWEKSAEQLLRHALTVVLLAGGKAELDDVVRVVLSAPSTVTEAGQKDWQRDSFCCQQLELAERRQAGHRALELARQYFLVEWARYPANTKYSTQFTFGRLKDFFQQDPLHRMFFSKTDFTPEILLDGAVLLVDEPALSGGDLGSLINGMLRLAVERMMKQRKCVGRERPVAIIWDEFQTSVTHEDTKFAAVARSHHCALVLASQNVPGVADVMNRDKTMALFGNCRTKVFFANDDPETNQYMADVVGKWPVEKTSKTTDHKGHSSKTKNPSQDEYAVPPRTATVLKSGGEDFAGKVTGIMVHSGYKLTKGQPWMKVSFNQNRPIWHWWDIWSVLSGNAGVIGWRRPAPDFRWLR